jgi:hypothetical protein
MCYQCDVPRIPLCLSLLWRYGHQTEITYEFILLAYYIPFFLDLKVYYTFPRKNNVLIYSCCLDILLVIPNTCRILEIYKNKEKSVPHIKKSNLINQIQYHQFLIMEILKYNINKQHIHILGLHLFGIKNILSKFKKITTTFSHLLSISKILNVIRFIFYILIHPPNPIIFSQNVLECIRRDIHGAIGE